MTTMSWTRDVSCRLSMRCHIATGPNGDVTGTVMLSKQLLGEENMKPVYTKKGTLEEVEHGIYLFLGGLSEEILR